MRRKTMVSLAAAAATLTAVVLTAFGQQKMVADKIVAVVGGSPILYSDVVKQAEQLTAEYRSQNYTSPRPPLAEALENLLEQKLLYNQAQIDSVEITNFMAGIEEMVSRQMDQMVADAGSIKELENQKRRPLYTIKDDLRKEIEEYYYAHAMRNNVMSEIKVTPGEVDRFFRRLDKDSIPIIPEQYVYAQITRLPKSTEAAKQRTRERLLEMRQRIIDGEKFERLAVMYSVDYSSALRGGEMDPAPKETFVEPFANALTKLRPGQVSGVVETEYGFHLIQLIDKPAADLYHMRHILLKPTYTEDELAETVVFLDSLAGVIRGGGLTFEKAAELYSDDAASKMTGGVVSNQELLYRVYGNTNPGDTSTKFIKDNLQPDDYKYLSRLKPGEISPAFVGEDLTMNQKGRMLKLNEIIPPHKADLSQDYLMIENMALQRKQQAHYDKWLDGKISEMYVRIDPIFKKEDFKNGKWFK